MSETETRKRTRSGGGAARRAARGSARVETARFIERNIPNFEILSAEALEMIEAGAETVLAEIGVNFVNNPGALERWRQAGQRVSIIGQVQAGQGVQLDLGLGMRPVDGPGGYQHFRSQDD